MQLSVILIFHTSLMMLAGIPQKRQYVRSVSLAYFISRLTHEQTLFWFALFHHFSKVALSNRSKTCINTMYISVCHTMYNILFICHLKSHQNQAHFVRFFFGQLLLKTLMILTKLKINSSSCNF